MIYVAISREQRIFTLTTYYIEANHSKTQKRPVPTGTDPYRSLAASYSHRGKPPTTIGAEELNFRVRYGNGCDLFAIATKPDGENVLSKLNNNVHASH